MFGINHLLVRFVADESIIAANGNRTWHVRIEPLTPTIGAIICDVNLHDVVHDDALFEAVHAAWMDHLVLFFRDQQISPEQHLAIGERFGPLHIHPAAPYAHDNPALMKIYTDEHSHRNNGESWHSDVSADEAPPMASILHMHEVPARGGDTLWANMYAAFEALSAPMQALLENLEAVHSANYDGYYGDHAPQRANPSAIHPVIRTHPVTGRKALFVNGGFTRRIRGLSPTESSGLLNMLFDHVKNPNFHCRFQWEANSVAIWDNRCTQHMAIWDYFPETRSGIRVTVVGDRPH